MTSTSRTPWTLFSQQPEQLGESPFWHPGEQRLYWVDIDGRAVCRQRPGEATERWALPTEPGCMAPVDTADGGGLVLALRTGIVRAPQWGGALQPLWTPDYDPAITRFNDGKADPFGRFWAGTIHEPRDAAAAVLYCLDTGRGRARGTAPALAAQSADAGHPATTVTRMAGGATVANGLAFSPDRRTLYWGDTTSHTVRAWDWDGERNVLSGERVFHQWPAKPAGWVSGMPGYGGRPDGATVDAEGNYWVAMFEGARVLQLSPAGDILRDIPLPAQCPTMPCLGGPDLKTLYVTTARHKRPADELQRYPDSGCVFQMRVEVPGLAVNFFDAHGT